jgi:hypothetical protein
MYPKLMETAGIGYQDLVDRLIQLALDRWHERRRNQVLAFRGEREIGTP